MFLKRHFQDILFWAVIIGALFAEGIVNSVLV